MELEELMAGGVVKVESQNDVLERAAHAYSPGNKRRKTSNMGTPAGGGAVGRRGSLFWKGLDPANVMRESRRHSMLSTIPEGDQALATVPVRLMLAPKST